ncbi:hypothetical protein [Sphingomonas sp. Root710]|uniref:hypothetical protein n=1 Tax=Sphingomonas sp. Root710 TaxID=1736594 RepID=UPI0012E387DB|nr:hypothetical protein [Sphingomonas sp. Root710]
MRNMFSAGAGRARALSHLAKKSLQVVLAGGITVSSTMGLAQSVDDPFGFQQRYITKRMRPICEDRALLDAFVFEVFGHYRANMSSTGDRQLAEEALARELTAGSRVSAQFLEWQGGQINGSCHLDLEITLPPQSVAQLGGHPQMRGDMWFNLELRDGKWTLVNVTDDLGSGDNSFRRFAAPFTDAMVEARLAAKYQMEAAAEQQRRDQISAEIKRRDDRARAERQAWIRRHPAEYAAQQRAEANRRAAQAADERRRRLACEAHGGTWGQRITEMFPACFFRTER